MERSRLNKQQKIEDQELKKTLRKEEQVMIAAGTYLLRMLLPRVKVSTKVSSLSPESRRQKPSGRRMANAVFQYG